MAKLIIGIGNPDEQYQNSRHNVGFMFLDYIAKKIGADGFVLDKKSDSLISKIKLAKPGTVLYLAKPQTYVNKSGEAVKKIIRNLKFEIRNLIVVHDDLDIPFGNIKISFDKNSGGHKGIESIMRMLKTKKFYRLRVGLGTRALTKARALSDSRRNEFVRNFVLSKFNPKESEELKNLFKKSSERLQHQKLI